MKDSVRDAIRANIGTVHSFLSRGEDGYAIDTILNALKSHGLTIEADWNTDMDSAPRDGTRVLLFVPPYGPSTGHYEAARRNWGPNASLWICHSVLNKEAQPTAWKPATPPVTDEGG